MSKWKDKDGRRELNPRGDPQVGEDSNHKVNPQPLPLLQDHRRQMLKRDLGLELENARPGLNCSARPALRWSLLTVSLREEAKK